MVVSSVGQPVITDAPARHVLYLHFVVSEEDVGATMQHAFAALYGHIGESRVIPAGPPFTIYNSAHPPFDMDVCAPLATPITASGDFHYMELPATRVVSMTHIGPYEELGRAYDTVENFIRDNKLSIVGAPREIYLSPPDTPASEIQTILEWPIA